jgi:dephospho-CoA kinase
MCGGSLLGFWVSVFIFRISIACMNISSIGITGGIACGKSIVRSRLSQLLGAGEFDADALVHAILDHDEFVREFLRTEFGEAVFDANGSVDRKFLGKIIFASEEKRRTLESVVHPKVRAAWVEHVERARSRQETVVVEIPLLFETKAESHFDITVVVACSRESQIKRMETMRGLTKEQAAVRIDSQWNFLKKSDRADFIVWNEGSLEVLDLQLAELLLHISNLKT